MTVNMIMAEAFWAGKPLKIQNTRVDVIENQVTMYLHGNAIVRRWFDRLEVSAAGHQTSTTSSRINAVLEKKGYKVFQRMHMWFVIGSPLAAHASGEPIRWPIRMDTSEGAWTLVDPGSAIEQLALLNADFEAP